MLNSNLSVNNTDRITTFRTRMQIGSNDIPTTSSLSLLFNSLESEGLKGSVIVDFRQTGEDVIRSTLFYSAVNDKYGAGIIVSYYNDSFYKVKNANGTISITAF